MQARDWPSAQWAREDCREEQLCVKPEGGKGASPADMWEKSLPGCGNSKGKLHEVGVGLVCGKKNREREGKWEEMRSERGEGAKSHRALCAVVTFGFTLNAIRRQMRNFHQVF